MLISMLKDIKIHKSTPACFDLNRSSSRSRSVLRQSYWII